MSPGIFVELACRCYCYNGYHVQAHVLILYWIEYTYKLKKERGIRVAVAFPSHSLARS